MQFASALSRQPHTEAAVSQVLETVARRLFSRQGLSQSAMKIGPAFPPWYPCITRTMQT